MSRLIHVVIVEQENRDCFSIGVIDNITIDCEESFKSRLKKALDEHFDCDTEIDDSFNYEDLFRYAPIELDVKADEYYYKIIVSETWFY